jgi:hypothetical protein
MPEQPANNQLDDLLTQLALAKSGKSSLTAAEIINGSVEILIDYINTYEPAERQAIKNGIDARR